MPRNRYHTNFIFKGRMGMLSPEEREIVPASTFSEWQGRKFSTIIGFNEDDPILEQIEFHRKFLSVKSLAVSAKCIWKVYCCYSSILERLKSKLKIFRQNKELVMETMQEIVQDIGITSACRIIGINVSLFYRWVNERFCFSSAFELCRKTNSQQLTIKEQNVSQLTIA
jgi:hypothetical protein